MKIALIIFRIGPSHGSLLQTYALYNVLKSLGHSVTIVNRKDKLALKTFIRRTLSRLCKTLTGEHLNYIFSAKAIPSRIMRNLNIFVNKHLSDDLIEFSDFNINKCVYDIFIVGSDQVWRPKYVQDISYYFLDFVQNLKNIKRISYAASFGVSEWEYSELDTLGCKKLAKLFNAISVREDTGVALCNKYLGVSATHVLDPTMLLDDVDYINLIDSQFLSSSPPTLAYSILDKNIIKDSIIDNVSRILKLSPISIKADENNPKYVETSIEFWLNSIRKSSFIITDSFHATVFAIIFNKPFIVIGNKSRGISRLTSLLNMLGLSNRLVYENDSIDIDYLSQEVIQWDLVNERRSFWKKKSLDYLKNNIV